MSDTCRCQFCQQVECRRVTLFDDRPRRERDEEKSVLHYYIPILEKAAERKLNQRHFLSTANVKKRQADDDNDILFKHFRWS